MVESPGTAPGSEPLITSAFISIVPKDISQVVARSGQFKGDDAFDALGPVGPRGKGARGQPLGFLF